MVVEALSLVDMHRRGPRSLKKSYRSGKMELCEHNTVRQVIVMGEVSPCWSGESRRFVARR